ncbi:cytochrome P450 [Mycena rebaudengoi]|nr:cytochrome P450 [Mycena rebaudengoi]
MIPVSGLVVVFGFLLLRLKFCRRSIISRIPGPPSSSWIYGNLPELLLNRLIVSDPLSLQYILRGFSFKHGPTLENAVNMCFGEKSVSGLQGEPHRRVRTFLNPAFSAGAVRKFMPVFERTAQMIGAHLEHAASSKSLIDICPALFIPTVNTIAEAVFGCTLEDMGAELIMNHERLLVMAATRSRAHILADVLLAYIPAPILRLALFIPTTAFRVIRKSKNLTNQLGERLVNDKLETSRRGLEMDNDVYSSIGDLLLASAVLLGVVNADDSNYSVDFAASQMERTAMTASEANTLAFAFRELAKDPQFQQQLRAEISSYIAASPKSDLAYNNMPLLNAFIKETLRIYPITPLPEQMATQDAILPLTRSIKTTLGEEIAEIPIRKGQIIMLGIASYQSLSFLGGPHTCLG